MNPSLRRINYFFALLVWGIIIVLLVSVPQSSTDAMMGFAVTDPPFSSLTYGIQAFLWWDHGFAGRDMDWIQRMAFSHVKQTFAWEDIQPERDVWSFGRADELLLELERRNLKVVARLSDAPEWVHPRIGARKQGRFVDARRAIWGMARMTAAFWQIATKEELAHIKSGTSQI